MIISRKKILNILIALVWLGNGLFCKVLNFVPRHEQIVGRILGQEHAFVLTKLIGCAEIMMAVWILSGIQTRWCARAQIVVVATMNIIEFTLVPDLLLWGRMNIVFAAMFVMTVYFNEWYNGPSNKTVSN